MALSFLDKDGLKRLRNVLKYLDNPNSITDPGQQTKLSRIETRRDYIKNAFKNLTDDDKKQLIEYIKFKTTEINEIVDAFKNFKDFSLKEDIAVFLDNLAKSINNDEIRLKIFSLIFINHPLYALQAIYEIKSNDFKEKICQSCAVYNPERGYIYALLNGLNMDINIVNKLNLNKLINEINYIQLFGGHSVLEKVLDDYKDSNNLINKINDRLKNRDFETIYTLSKNINLLNSYKFSIHKNDLLLLKWAIDITDDSNKNLKKEVSNKNLKPYSVQWIIFLSINLLKMDAQKQKLSLIILNYLITTNEKFIEKHSDKIAETIVEVIQQHNKIPYDLLEVLERLKTTKGLYNLIDFIYKKKLNWLKDDRIKKYINKNAGYTKEFNWLSQLEKSQKYIAPQTNLNTRTIICILMQKTPKGNYKLLRLLKENNKKLYFKIMRHFENIIANKLQEYEKYIKLIIVLKYECKNENVLNITEQYSIQNLDSIKRFIEICDPDFISEYYIENIKVAINRKDGSITSILEGIEDLQIKNKCSCLVLESFFESDFDELPNIWKHLTLGIEDKIKFKDKVLEMINKETIKFTKENIVFINKVGIEPSILYNSLKEQSNKKYLLDIWHQANEIGKIINTVRDEMIINAKTLEDFNNICNILEDYNINDSNLRLLIKVKVYAIISMELLGLDMVEESINKLNYLSEQLVSYGLVDRFLMDDLLQKELGRRIVDYIFGRFLNNVHSNELWAYYWDSIMKDLKNIQHNSSSGKVEMFFNYLAKSRMAIKWFLNTMNNTDMNPDIYINIIETILILLNKQNKIISQNEHEIGQIKAESLMVVGRAISKALGNIEKTIINRSNDVKNDILVENLKKLRRELKSIGIEPVENIDNYGMQVKFNNDIHKNTQALNQNEGIVDSLGVRVNGENILFSTLLSVD